MDMLNNNFSKVVRRRFDQCVWGEVSMGTFPRIRGNIDTVGVIERSGRIGRLNAHCDGVEGDGRERCKM